MNASTLRVPLIIRGEIIDEDTFEFRGSGGGRFTTADAAAYVDRLLPDPAGMSDLTGLRLSDILEYLDALGKRLTIERNPHLQRAYEIARTTSMLSDGMLREIYEKLPLLFRKDFVRHRMATLLDGAHLDDWAELPCFPLAKTRARMRAFGARSVHIVPGNTPAIGAVTILNSAITRGDAIIKTPSNDPMTTAAVARTMVEAAQDHPLTRHVSVAYWKGGDQRVERRLYDGRRIEKIVAWGGVASIRHVMRELQPGIELITLDPKQGMAIIDAAALREEESALQAAAAALALDIGSMNQEACFNTRLVYLVGRGTAEDLEIATRLAKLTFARLTELPAALSAPHRAFDPELKAELDALQLLDLGHQVIGGRRNEGAVIVSHCRRPVEFANRLGCRVANIVPVGTFDEALAALSRSVQTLCVYPESLKDTLRDRLAHHGVQRIVSLGHAAIDPFLASPQDGMELLRKMCKWVIEERPVPELAAVT